MRLLRLLPPLLLLLAAVVRADGPADNVPDNVRRIPPLPKNFTVAEGDRAELQADVASLGKEIESLRNSLKGKPNLLDLLPDVQVYHKAVDWALRYNELYNAGEIGVARNLLKQGMARAKALAEGKPTWTTQTGLVVRGYVSKIDGSVQPYGLIVPASYQPNAHEPYRLDLWFHGRGEYLTELSFIDGRQKSYGEFTPPHAFVLHPYGRYCNANKLAGEIDTFEALDHARKHYPIDEDRVSVRGFSMGGAACWQFAVHYPGLWASAAPGAGFSETADFLKVFQKETLKPTWYEQKLWHLYDCTDYARNLYNLPTVAYSGEIDSQKQAADMMEKAMAGEGLRLVHIIGPKTGHGYHPEAKKEVNRRIDAIVAKGRVRVPTRVLFQTWTLRYNTCDWVAIDGMKEHWTKARVDAEITRDSKNADNPLMIRVRTDDVTALTLSFGPGECPLDEVAQPRVQIDDTSLTADVLSDRSWVAHFRKTDGKWERVKSPDDGMLRKRPGLQGPIDDAFLDSFVMVKPTGKPMQAAVGKWVESEMNHAITHWRSQYRGDARVKDDTALGDDDIARSNLVLWGDPKSNAVLGKIASKLPIAWGEDGTITVRDKKYSADKHALILIAPNPLNPKRYVVLNSGFTFREYDYLNNARQVPKLPDWAVVDVSQPASSRFPGGIPDAGFFDEAWRLKAKESQ